MQAHVVGCGEWASVSFAAAHKILESHAVLRPPHSPNPPLPLFSFIKGSEVPPGNPGQDSGFPRRLGPVRLPGRWRMAETPGNPGNPRKPLETPRKPHPETPSPAHSHSIWLSTAPKPHASSWSLAHGGPPGNPGTLWSPRIPHGDHTETSPGPLPLPPCQEIPDKILAFHGAEAPCVFLVAGAWRTPPMNPRSAPKFVEA